MRRMALTMTSVSQRTDPTSNFSYLGSLTRKSRMVSSNRINRVEKAMYHGEIE